MTLARCSLRMSAGGDPVRCSVIHRQTDIQTLVLINWYLRLGVAAAGRLAHIVAAGGVYSAAMLPCAAVRLFGVRPGESRSVQSTCDWQDQMSCFCSKSRQPCFFSPPVSSDDYFFQLSKKSELVPAIICCTQHVIKNKFWLFLFLARISSK